MPFGWKNWLFLWNRIIQCNVFYIHIHTPNPPLLHEHRAGFLEPAHLAHSTLLDHLLGLTSLLWSQNHVPLSPFFGSVPAFWLYDVQWIIYDDKEVSEGIALLSWKTGNEITCGRKSIPIFRNGVLLHEARLNLIHWTVRASHSKKAKSRPFILSSFFPGILTL